MKTIQTHKDRWYVMPELEESMGDKIKVYGRIPGTVYFFGRVEKEKMCLFRKEFNPKGGEYKYYFEKV